MAYPLRKTVEELGKADIAVAIEIELPEARFEDGRVALEGRREQRLLELLRVHRIALAGEGCNR